MKNNEIHIHEILGDNEYTTVMEDSFAVVREINKTPIKFIAIIMEIYGPSLEMIIDHFTDNC